MWTWWPKLAEKDFPDICCHVFHHSSVLRWKRKSLCHRSKSCSCSFSSGSSVPVPRSGFRGDGAWHVPWPELTAPLCQCLLNFALLIGFFEGWTELSPGSCGIGSCCDVTMATRKPRPHWSPPPVSIAHQPCGDFWCLQIVNIKVVWIFLNTEQ